MSEELQKLDLNQLQKKLPLPIQQCMDIAYRTVKGDIKSPEDISRLYQITIHQALQLICNSTFASLVHNLMLAYQKYKFDAIALKRMMDIIEFSGEEKNAIAATQVASNILGVNQSKQKQPVNYNFNFDTMIRKVSKEQTFPGM